MTKTYAESPLGQNVALVLNKITELKQKYPVTAESPVEHTHASMLVNLFEKLIPQIQNTFVPIFDNQKLPNLNFIEKGVMLAYVMSIRNSLLENLISRDCVLFLNFKKELPSIVKQSLHAKKAPLADQIIRQIGLKKGELSKNCLSIPGKDLNIFFNEIEHNIRIELLYQYKFKLLERKDKISDEARKEILEKMDEAIHLLENPSERSEAFLPLLSTIENAIKEHKITPKSLTQDGLVNLLSQTIQDSLFPGMQSTFILPHPLAFTIAHPMTFELAEFVVDLLNKAPAVNELVPFLNPEAISEVVNYIPGIPSITNKKNEDEATPSYFYEYTHENKTVSIDGEMYYNSYRNVFLHWFLPEFESYFSNYAETPHVQEELSRLQPLHELLETTTSAINYKMEEFTANHVAELINADKADTIDLLNKAITEHSSLLEKNNALQKEFYLIEEKFSEAVQNIGMEFPCYAIFDCKEKLLMEVGTKIIPLYNKEEETKISLRGLFLRLCDANKKTYLAQIGELQTTLDNIQLSCEDNAIDVLENAIATIPVMLANIEELAQILNEKILKPTQEFLSHPTLDSLDDADDALLIKNETGSRMKCILTKGQKLLHKFDETRAKLNTEKSLLQARLENAQYNASLSSANPEKILLDAQVALEKVEVAQEEVRARLQIEQDKVSEQELRVNELTQQIDQAQEELAKLVRSKTAIIQEVKNTASLFTPNNELPDENELFTSHLSLFGLLQSQIVHLTLFKDGQADLTKKLRAGFDISEALQQVLTILESSEKPKDKFSQIKKLPDLAPNSFALLFNLINASPGLKEELKSRENELYSTNKKISNFLINLQAEVNRKKTQLTHVNETLEILSWMKKTCDKNNKQDMELNSHLRELNASFEEQQREYTALKEQFDAYSQSSALELEHLEQQKQQHICNIDVLTQFTQLITDINDLKPEIDAFAENDNYFYSDERQKHTISTLKQRQNTLANKMEGLVNHEDVQKNPNYQGPLTGIQAILDANDKKIHEAIDGKLIRLIAADEKVLLDMEAVYPKLAEDEVQQIEHINTLLTGFADFAQTHVRHVAIIEQLQSELVEFDEEYRKAVTAKQNSHHTLRQKALASGKKFAEYLTNEFNKLAQDINENNPVRLGEIKEQLAKLPNVDALTTFAQSIQYFAAEANFLEALIAARKNAEEQLATCEEINARGVITKPLLAKLEAYLPTRPRRYKVKDFFTPHDKNERERFITDLKAHLNAYQAYGESDKVLKTIRENINRFPGLQLQTLLNQCFVAINDMNRNMPDDLDAYHQEAQLSLENQKEVNGKYVDAINDLYRQVEQMAAYGTQLQEENDTCAPIVTKLANELRFDIDHFVTAHSEALPDDAEYSQFKENFLARLHSQDTAMSVHNAAWKPFVANVVIGFFTLGIALGIKLIHSKISSGRCSFFLETTAHLNVIQQVEQFVPSNVPVCA